MPIDLAALRSRTDPLADAALEALWPHAPPVGSLLDAARAHRGTEPAVAALLDDVDRRLEAMDRAAIEPGRRLAMRNAPITFFALLAGSLIESFAMADGARVLAATRRLVREPKKRVYETASMVRDVLLPGGLSEGSRGVDAVLRVRLLHSWVRRHLRAHGFDEGKLGAPVNQHDMLHTLFCFDRVIVRALKTFGASVSAAEDEGHYALWREVGALMGIDDDVLPDDAASAELVYAELRSQYAPNEDSVELAHAVLKGFAWEPPFLLSSGALFALSREMIGDELAAALDFPPRRVLWDRVTKMERTAMAAFDWTVGVVPLGTWAELGAGHAFVEVNRARVLLMQGEADFRFRVA